MNIILLNNLFGNYISDDWEVVNNIPEAIAMGIILLRNKLNNNISIVSMTTNQPYAISKVDGLSYGELEFMKSFLFTNEMKKELFPGYGKLINCNPHTTNGIYIRNVNSKFKIFEQLMYSKRIRW